MVMQRYKADQMTVEGRPKEPPLRLRSLGLRKFMGHIFGELETVLGKGVVSCIRDEDSDDEDPDEGNFDEDSDEESDV
ncbi:hypothetical protein FRB94_002260 [Tulasnella sp. JGI-2019a]|nr:hypothetical protein FRB93_004070 [Tulasnella sp. JGI-2019a]KAG9004584.1 hypothetical protein FRB94_002260 [Tulasnella sp. JGI-2019a]KAG9031142.1 hypothetical protein FRB95_003116 [Tulasnella sp. JGI-2019a]